jgi:hypothetical protein
MLRGLLWLGGGLLLFVAIVIISSPELAFSDIGATGRLMVLAGIAGIPGSVLSGVIAAKRGTGKDVDAPPGASPEHRPSDHRKER